MKRLTIALSFAIFFAVATSQAYSQQPQLPDHGHRPPYCRPIHPYYSGYGYAPIYVNPYLLGSPYGALYRSFYGPGVYGTGYSVQGAYGNAAFPRYGAYGNSNLNTRPGYSLYNGR
jgi:hypothetical protein